MKVTKKEFETIVRICERAEQLDIAPKERITLIMDLENTHNSVGLDLDGLLAADDFDFAHDVVGIQNHMNRDTKELEGFFVPRYARKDVEALIDDATVRSEAHDTNVDTLADKSFDKHDIEQ